MLIENGFSQLIFDTNNKSNDNDKFKRLKIGVTQPRRVAAITLSQRVQSEMLDNDRLNEMEYLN